MGYFLDLGTYLKELDRQGKLIRIGEPVIKETELTPLVRLQYRGLPEPERKGFLFTNVMNSRGRKFNMNVATGVYASSKEIYAIGLQCDPTNDAIQKKWESAQLKPLEPIMVEKAPVQEVVVTGDDLLKEESGLESIPIPVEVPGFSGQIRTSTHVITKDPETGIRNMGNYSGHIFGTTKILWEINRGNHGWIHYNKWKKMGKPMPAAIVIGGPPSLFYVAAAKLPYGVDELTIAGGIAGKPLEVIKCRSIDLEVPANAEIIIEGEISTEYMEPGNAYGEFPGYMATTIKYRPIFNVKTITHRKNPTFVHIMSQFPPSESSVVRRISMENVMLNFLRHDAKVPGILDVAWHEMSQGQWGVIRIKKNNNAHSWQVLNLASGYDPSLGKYYITVDEDIDPRDIDSVIWALSWRVQPHRDTRIINGRVPVLDDSAYRSDASLQEKEWPGGVGTSCMLIDATMKWPYPPTSLPRKEFMDRALEKWKKLNLPELNLKVPWYGYELGAWSDENRDDANKIINGEHLKIGERLEKGRIRV